MLEGIAQSARRIFGVALLAVRGAVRTKVVAALLALLAVCVAALPGAVKGDGTPDGDLRILLSYTLGFSFGILCLATLWSACALFAAEIDSSRIQLSAVKPVRPFEFWVGKWLALLVFNAVLLTAVYAAVYAQVQWRLYRNGWAASDCLVSRRVSHPLLPSAKEEALQQYEDLRVQNALPKNLSRREVLRTLEEKADERYDGVNPGETASWMFHLTQPLQNSEAVTVRVRFDTEFSTREQIKGVFRLAAATRPDVAVAVPLDDFTQNEIEFVVDARAFAAAAPVGGLRDFELAFRHGGDPKKTTALMLRGRRDVVLLTPGGSFVANLARAALVQGGVLALLAAFGLTLSACFSVPVAAFSATVLLVLTVVANSVVNTISVEDEKQWQNRAGVAVSRAVHWASDRAMRVEPLESLTRGERIDGGTIGGCLLWNLALMPAVFALLGCAVLRRRELAEGE